MKYMTVLRSTAFDGVWALALAMNETDNEMKEMNSSMAEFTYESREHAEILFSNLISQTFFGQGVSNVFYCICVKMLFS